MRSKQPPWVRIPLLPILFPCFFVYDLEGWPSGRWRSPAKRVGSKQPPLVRIQSPPFNHMKGITIINMFERIPEGRRRELEEKFKLEPGSIVQWYKYTLIASNTFRTDEEDALIPELQKELVSLGYKLEELQEYVTERKEHDNRHRHLHK